MERDKIIVSFGKTINMGNYESTRIDIGIEISLENRDRVDHKNLDRYYLLIKNYVEEKEEEIKEEQKIQKEERRKLRGDH